CGRTCSLHRAGRPRSRRRPRSAIPTHHRRAALRTKDANVNCTEPDCTGTIDQDGYCSVCGAAAPTGAEAAGFSKAVEKTQVTRRGMTARTTVRSARLGAGLVEIQPVPTRDPGTAVMIDPQVAEDKRHCAMCDSPVGRSVGDTPGRSEGFCRQCGQPFS